ncbi:MAG: DEAD/DEAH box helicase, partial [Candidatus Eisenbacteria bacterium]|nr:DEAD/DEAH box helicase [Candidatus Eisenbacteria bacterium]
PEDGASAAAPTSAPSEAESIPLEGPWSVRYLVQPREEPSLLLPLSEVWKARGKKAAVLAARGIDAREAVLAALGQAAAISPPIAGSLEAPEPVGFETDLAGAHQFLTETAPLLEEAGFGVLLPAWWTGRGTRARLSMRAHVSSPPAPTGGGISLDQILGFRWEVALGGVSLDPRELEALASLKAPLVRLRGQWVEVNPDEIRRAIELWRRNEGGKATLRDVVRMSVGAAAALGGDGGAAGSSAAADSETLEAEASVAAEGWVASLLASLNGEETFAEFSPPERFIGTLRPYQVRGFSWLGFLTRWGLGACLADDMGLGKTVQTLALIQRLRSEGERRPFLLVCPTSVVANWRKEAERFTPDLPVLVHHGIERRKGAAFREEASRQAMVLSSYALLHRDLEFLLDVRWAGIVLDEAQNIKNAETKQARAARTVRADCRIALTGTPVENHVADLWSIMEFLNPGLLGTQRDFRRRFFVPIQAARDREAMERLRRITRPFVLRREKTDPTVITDLPEKLEMKIFCRLTKEQASLYQAVVREAERDLRGAEGIRRRGVILATLSKLKQVCNHPAHFLGDGSQLDGRSGKLARLVEMIEELLDVGDAALVFTQFAEMGALLQRFLEESFGREVLFLHGGVVRQHRERMVERFQSGDAEAPRIFVLSLKAGGTGLNLMRANHVFHFDRWWNPAVENQATDRAFRIGQTRNVQVHKFVCVGTVEEAIDTMIESKKEVAAQVVGAGEGWLTELSNSELRKILALRPDAVEE